MLRASIGIHSRTSPIVACLIVSREEAAAGGCTIGRMLNWLAKLRGTEKSVLPLLGKPAVRRLKHYAALSGYAYEYAFEGYRQHASGEHTEYVFTVSGDRRSWRAMTILLSTAGAGAWETANGRALASNERYAIAKLALFGAFDDAASPADVATAVEVNGPEVEAILKRLDP